MRRSRSLCVVIPVVAGLALLPVSPAGAAAGTTVRVSVAPGGGQSTGFAALPAMSSDGTTVLFGSDGGDLDPRATGGAQLYVHDLVSGMTELVTVNTGNGGSAGGLTGEHDIDADGYLVVFDSTASDLSGDPDSDACTIEQNGDEENVNCVDVFARDRMDGQTFKVSVGPNGEEANGNSVHPRVSDDGRRVVFLSEASNLVPGDTVGSWDVFVRFLPEEGGDGVTRRLTAGEPGAATGEPVISADGGTVAFWSNSTTLDPTAPAGVNIFVHDLATDQVSALPIGAVDGTQSYSPTLSGDGRLVGFMSYDELVPEDLESSYDLYLHDRVARTTELVNRNDDGGRALNADRLELSDDGTHALFRGGAGLVPGTPTGQGYVYVRNLVTGTVRVASLADDGSLLNSGADTGWRSLSPDGAQVAFMSRASNAVAGDTNGTDDIFVRVLGDLVPLPTPGDLATTLDGSGQTVYSGTDADASVPVVAAITPPEGLIGDLTVDLSEVDPAAAPAGYEFFGQQLAISGPAATVADPYVVAFTVDASLLGTVAPADVQVFRNGVAVADCTDPISALPDPCVAGRAEGPDGDAVVTVRTSAFSVWTLGRLAYQVTGPLAPVEALPTVNVVKAGSAVPVTFGLGGDHGPDVFADGYPRTTADCSGSSAQVQQTTAPGGAALTYDEATGTYTYVWKTSRDASGCRDLVVRFRDGTELTMRFQLR